MALHGTRKGGAETCVPRVPSVRCCPQGRQWRTSRAAARRSYRSSSSREPLQTRAVLGRLDYRAERRRSTVWSQFVDTLKQPWRVCAPGWRRSCVAAWRRSPPGWQGRKCRHTMAHKKGGAGKVAKCAMLSTWPPMAHFTRCGAEVVPQFFVARAATNARSPRQVGLPCGASTLDSLVAIRR
jgi:hypothetical protein